MVDTPPEESRDLDLVGTTSSTLGLGLVEYGVLWSGSRGLVWPTSAALT
ncbi:hypothetical protein [Frankia sp. CcWB3]